MRLIDRNDELGQRCDQLRELMDRKAEQSRRHISFQIAIMENQIYEVLASDRIPEVSILGINATGPLHQGREVLLTLLRKGGKLRVLLLNPNEPSFDERCARERDIVGRIMAELFASFYILLDIWIQVAESDPSSANRLEVRLHNQRSDRGLVIVSGEDSDGVVLENPYPERPGARGVEGRTWVLVQRRARDRVQHTEDVEYFNNLWNNEETRRVEFRKPSGILQISSWPFVIRP